ncbi:hypothetical protein MMC30_006505 [Trapelia coarctata]|nr:hypothetical protein [Trapelia coarctata]
MMSSLIVALIPPGRVPDHVCAAHNAAVKLGRRYITQADSPENIFVALLGLHQRVYLVIDGLDEATRIPDVLDSLLSISQTSQNLTLMVFSRDVPCINKRLSHAVHINLTPESTKPDIDKYVHDEIDKLEIPEMTPHIKEHATRFLQDRANGMFLWATLMVDSLRASTSEQNFADTMADVPTGLTDLWLRGIHQLWQKSSNMRGLARQTILWVCTAFVPLQWSELQCALALDLQAPNFLPERKPFLQVTLDLCSPFVSYDITSQTIRPVHPSFHDFIFGCEVQDIAQLPERAFFCSKPEAHRMLSLHCLTYLTQAYSAHSNLIEQPLTRYACLWWTKHLLATEPCQELADAAETFLSLHRRAWILHFLVWEKTTYPLHILARYHTDLLNWSSHNSSMFNLTLDLASVIIDINKMRLHQRTTAFPYLDPLQQLAHSMTYFDNMMVARDLARLLTQANQLPPGISLFESALADQSTYSGTPDAPDSVWLLNVLGLLYDQQSLTEKATSIQERALAIQSTHLGVTHPETVWTQNELGRMYRHQSRYAEAETMHLTALHTLRSLLPDPNQQSHSPEIAWTSSTLARVYRKQHNPAASLPHLTSALKTRTHLIGPTHPHSLWLLSDIAQCHYELGDFDFAERYHREAMAGRTEVLGLEHPDTLWSLNNLGVVLAAKAVATSTGDGVARDRWRDEAEEMQRRAYEAQKKVLGVAHPHTVWTRDVLSTIPPAVGPLQSVLAPSQN